MKKKKKNKTEKKALAQITERRTKHLTNWTRLIDLILHRRPSQRTDGRTETGICLIYNPSAAMMMRSTIVSDATSNRKMKTSIRACAQHSTQPRYIVCFGVWGLLPRAVGSADRSGNYRSRPQRLFFLMILPPCIAPHTHTERGYRKEEMDGWQNESVKK